MRRGILSSLSCLLPPRVRSTVYINHQEASLRPLQRGETQMGWPAPNCYLTRREKWQKELPLLKPLSYSLCKATRLWGGEVQTAPYLLPWSKFTWLQFSGIPTSLWQPRSHSLLVFYWKSKASTDQTKPVSSCLGEKMKKELDNKPDTTVSHQFYYCSAIHQNDPKRFQVFIVSSW